jgi:Tol biopolymer transport system component
MQAVPAPSRSIPFDWQNRKLLAGIVVVALAFIAAVDYWAVRWRARNNSFNLQKMEIVKLTQSGKVESVAISADGRYVAYVLRDPKGVGLWIRQVATQSEVQILPSEEIEFEGLSFSPDGNYIYFVRAAKKLIGFRYVYVMPALGGTVRQLASDVDSPVSFSPDGRQFAYTRGVPQQGATELRLANTDGSNNRLLATIAETYPGFQPGGSWSPDGSTIALSSMHVGARPGFVLHLVSIRDGSVRRLYSGDYLIGRPLWLPEGDALLVSLQDHAGRGQLWKLSYPQGQLSRLTNDLADYDSQIDATHNAGTVAVIQEKAVSHVWLASENDLSAGRQITFGEPPVLMVAASPQGKILAASGDGELSIMNSDGSQTTPVPGAHTFGYRYPAACGRYFLFSSYQPGRIAMTRMDADGSNLTILVAEEVWSPVCSPDVRSVFYVEAKPPYKIMRVPVEGGTPTHVATVLGGILESRLVISPDGKFLAYAFQEYTPEPDTKLAVIPVDGSSAAKVMEVPGWSYENACLRWSPDGKSLQSLVTRDGITNIWEQPLAGGKPKQLTKFTSGLMFDFNWFPDGKQLLLTRGDVSRDVVLLSNFR